MYRQGRHSMTLYHSSCYLGLLLGHGPHLVFDFYQRNVLSKMFSFFSFSTSAFFGGLPLRMHFLTKLSSSFSSSSDHFFFKVTIKKNQWHLSLVILKIKNLKHLTAEPLKTCKNKNKRAHRPSCRSAKNC